VPNFLREEQMSDALIARTLAGPRTCAISYFDFVCRRLNYWRSAIYVAIAHLYLTRTAEAFLRSL
jgi:hypothetical protein